MSRTDAPENEDELSIRAVVVGLGVGCLLAAVNLQFGQDSFV
jgi:uncharacterized oligopeptide transporter (OPT) family protein